MLLLKTGIITAAMAWLTNLSNKSLVNIHHGGTEHILDYVIVVMQTIVFKTMQMAVASEYSGQH